MEAITRLSGDLDMEETTQRKLDDLTDNVSRLVTRFEVITAQMNSLEKTVAKIETCYVTLLEFRPVQKIVYGMVIITCVAVIGAMIKLVVMK